MSKSRFDKQLNVGVRPEHKAALAALAAREGESQSYVIRRLIRQEAERQGVWNPAQLALTLEPRDNGPG